MDRCALLDRASQLRVVESITEGCDQVYLDVQARVQTGNQIGEMHGDATASRFNDERDAQPRRAGRLRHHRSGSQRVRRTVVERMDRVGCAFAGYGSRHVHVRSTAISVTRCRALRGLAAAEAIEGVISSVQLSGASEKRRHACRRGEWCAAFNTHFDE
ncbi:hypothetical protein LGN30_14655 [Burkholderia seminalis]|nr:hypothetical protein [Burkholderia seminalis]